MLAQDGEGGLCIWGALDTRLLSGLLEGTSAPCPLRPPKPRPPTCQALAAQP